MKRETYTFRIDRFTPETLPLERLAAYLKELAELFGNHERVHFKSVKRGSAQLVSTVEREAAPKVRDRLQLLKTVAPPRDVRAAFNELNRLLRSDDAVGALKRGKATVISFPGRREKQERIGPFTQPTEITGQVVRIGGTDKTAHALVEDSEGRVISVEMSRDQARDIRSLLYEPTAVRISGPGRWVRSETGAWQLEDMKLQSWEPLSDATLRQAVSEIRLIETGWSSESDPHALLEQMRHGDDEIH